MSETRAWYILGVSQHEASGGESCDAKRGLMCQTCPLRGVMIMDNCEKGSHGWSLAEVAVTVPQAIDILPPTTIQLPPCFIAGFCCCSLAHLSV